jgi:type IV secretory pathway VirB10-like protein
MPFALDISRVAVLWRSTVPGRGRARRQRRSVGASLMRNLLAFIGGVVLIVGGLGFYLGWFKVQKQPTTDPGTSRYQLDIDQSKFQQDTQRLFQAGQEKAGQLVQPKPATTAPTTTAPAAAPQPPAGPGATAPPWRGPFTPTTAPRWQPMQSWPH